MFELKQLSRDSLDRALEKAERYRLLNESWQAESICRDILATDPGHQRATIMLLLAITDQFGAEGTARASAAMELLDRIKDEYARCYYTGIVHERRGTAQLGRNVTGAGEMAYDWLRRAMEWYEKAEKIHPPGNEDALLRWNTCVRLMQRRPDIQAASGADSPLSLE
jgi:hypothetical protein